MIKKYLITIVLLSIPVSFMSINVIKLKKAQSITKPIYNKDMSSPFKDFESPVKLEFRAKNPNIMANDIAEYKIKQKEIKAEEDRLRKEAELKEQKEIEERQSKIRNIVSRGGDVKYKKIKVYITYYSNSDTQLEGGQLDKKGNMLTSHNGFVCAMPKDVSYGSVLILEDSIPVIENGNKVNANQFKVVDSGGAIKWRNQSKTECNVDIFVPNVSSSWLSNNMGRQTREGILYYK